MSKRVALVAGGSRGIGRAIALAFADEGAAVAVAARSLSKVEAVAAACRERGAEARAIFLDVTDEDSCRRAVRAAEELGPIDIAVYSAGVLHARRFLDLSEEEWEDSLAVNLTGAFYLMQAVMPAMVARGEGRVIAISSIAGKIGAKFYTAYGASKHGLIGLIRALAVEYARSGVTFNAICPAYVETDMMAEALTRVMAETGRDRENALRTFLTPQGRLVQPEEVAALCLFLAGPETAAINGQAFTIDGGQIQT